jgi:hypothetical protein
VFVFIFFSFRGNKQIAADHHENGNRQTNQNKQMLAPSPAQRTPENQELIVNHAQREKTKRKEPRTIRATKGSPWRQGVGRHTR